MTPREKAVVRAVVKALRGQGEDDMDALAMSVAGGTFAAPQKVKKRAALLLEALTNA